MQTVLGQIGMNNVMAQPPSGEQDEGYDEDEQVITYPETPDRRITFGDLLRKAQYGEDIVEQYASVKDIEVRALCIPHASLHASFLYMPAFSCTCSVQLHVGAVQLHVGAVQRSVFSCIWELYMQRSAVNAAFSCYSVQLYMPAFSCTCQLPVLPAFSRWV